jgi:cytochrome c-type biogenesis protein
MGEQAVYQISLVAAYMAGVVALFAPCCISYLFPAYLGNIFKERKQVLGMTMVYSLGIWLVMLPVVLGARALSGWFFRLHDQTYLFGGVLMIIVAGLAFLGIKMPMPRLGVKTKSGNSDVISTLSLGVVSGITSACCAPVLVGVITLSSLSPTLLQSLGVGAAYVLGMVSPLYVASVFIDRGNILEKPWLKKSMGVVELGGKKYRILVSNLVAAGIFLITGLLMIWLTSSGRLAMPTAESAVTQGIKEVAVKVTEVTRHLPVLNWGFLVGGVYLMYRLVRKVRG